MENKKTYKVENEIDLLELFRTIKKGKKTVIRFVIIFGLIGLFITVLSKKEFTASTTVIPQVSESNIGANLGGLAAIAGINLGGGSSKNIPPNLYPNIVQSIPFQKELLNTALSFPELKEGITYKEYYRNYKKRSVLSVIKEYTIGLPGKFFNLFKTKPKSTTREVTKEVIYRISAEENKFFKKLQKQLVIKIDKKDNFIQISFSMSAALPAAQMAKKVQELLQKAITNFKIQKTKDELKFIEERYNELKKDFNKKQIALASFKDRNRGLITSRSQSRLERLQSEYNLAYEVYSELAKQLETQKIKVKENTPVFTIIEPVSVPINSSNPKKGLIMAISLLLGLFSGVFFILTKKWVKSLNI